MPRLGEIMDETRAEIRQVLTPEQRERLDAEMPSRRGRRGPRARPRRGVPGDTASAAGGVPPILDRYSLHNQAGLWNSVTPKPDRPPRRIVARIRPPHRADRGPEG
jgi:hypothetical protein